MIYHAAMMNNSTRTSIRNLKTLTKKDSTEPAISITGSSLSTPPPSVRGVEPDDDDGCLSSKRKEKEQSLLLKMQEQESMVQCSIYNVLSTMFHLQYCIIADYLKIIIR